MQLSAPLLKQIGPYRLRLSFGRVLRVLDAMADETLPPADKIDVAIRLLVCWPRPVLSTSKAALWGGIYDRCIKPKPAKIPPEDNTITFDFKQDAEYILAAFRQAYGIDLICDRDCLDWRVFLALFQGLPADTRISEIMALRAQPFPRPNEYNQEEIRALRQAKRAFALDLPDNPVGAFDSGISKQMDDLFAQYRKKAGEK